MLQRDMLSPSALKREVACPSKIVISFPERSQSKLLLPWKPQIRYKATELELKVLEPQQERST
jgi:hypothetical protein